MNVRASTLQHSVVAHESHSCPRLFIMRICVPSRSCCRMPSITVCLPAPAYTFCCIRAVDLCCIGLVVACSPACLRSIDASLGILADSLHAQATFLCSRHEMALLAAPSRGSLPHGLTVSSIMDLHTLCACSVPVAVIQLIAGLQHCCFWHRNSHGVLEVHSGWLHWHACVCNMCLTVCC
jgi:hypothetical protein